MAKRNETVKALLEMSAEWMVMRHRMIRAVVRFGICMLIALAFLIGVGLGRML